MTFPTNHRLAIRAITNCVENHSYGSYKDAVQSMLPLYDAAPDLLSATLHLLQVYKDIVGAMENAQPYSINELTEGSFAEDIARAEAAISKAKGKS